MRNNGRLFFLALSGVILWPLGQALADDVINDDLIVIGSACIGFDCVNGEAFGFDTLRLKENNLRIHALDTSVAAAFPSEDWRIVFNESANGGRSVFFVQDETTEIFSLEANAPRFSLYVDDGGRVGLGTSTPVVELHVVDGDTPTLRLEQDGSSGFTPQTWDVAGNEVGFFIRDTTNGSKLPFRIRVNAPSSSIDIAGDGDVGIGEDNPQTKLHVTGGDGTLRLSNTENNSTNKDAFVVGTHYTTGEEEVLGLGVQSVASDSFVLIGGGNLAYNTATTIFFVTGQDNTTTGGVERLRIEPDGDFMFNGGGALITAGNVLEVGTDASNGNGASLTDAGIWTDASSRAHKINIRDLDTVEAVAAVKGLEPVTYSGKQNPDEVYVGFIAEDVPELVAMNSRKGIAAIEISAVVTKVVQEHQRTIEAQERTNQTLEEMIAAQSRSIGELTSRIAQLEKLLSENSGN